MKRKCLKKLVFFPNMIVVTVITKITLFSLTMRNKNNAIFSVFFSFSSSLYSDPRNILFCTSIARSELGRK